MIIGTGMIARAFEEMKEDLKILIFASGVSDSKFSVGADFLREENLIVKALKDHREKLFVYFSTCSVLDPDLADTLYVHHKLKMENIIKVSGNNFLIIRASNVVGFTGNPNTIFNFFKDKIKGGQTVEIWQKACRNFIDVEDLVRFTVTCISSGQKNKLLTFANPVSVRVTELVTLFESYLGLECTKLIIDRGGCYQPATEEVKDIIVSAGIEFDESYLKRLFKKYLR